MNREDYYDIDYASYSKHKSKNYNTINNADINSDLIDIMNKDETSAVYIPMHIEEIVSHRLIIERELLFDQVITKLNTDKLKYQNELLLQQNLLGLQHLNQQSSNNIAHVNTGQYANTNMNDNSNNHHLSAPPTPMPASSSEYSPTRPSNPQQVYNTSNPDNNNNTRLQPVYTILPHQSSNTSHPTTETIYTSNIHNNNNNNNTTIPNAVNINNNNNDNTNHPTAQSYTDLLESLTLQQQINTETNNRLIVIQDELSTLQTSYTQLQQENNTLTHNIQQYTHNIHILNDNKSILETQLSEYNTYKDQNLQYIHDIHTYQTNNNILKQQYHTAEIEIISLKDKVALGQDQLIVTRNQLQEVQQELLTSQEQVTRLIRLNPIAYTSTAHATTHTASSAATTPLTSNLPPVLNRYAIYTCLQNKYCLPTIILHYTTGILLTLLLLLILHFSTVVYWLWLKSHKVSIKSYI